MTEQDHRSVATDQELGLNRRQFLTAGAATALSFALPQSAQAARVLPAALACSQITVPTNVPFVEPAPFVMGGALDINLNSADFSAIPNASNASTVRSYNCAFPGPTIRVQPGGTIKLTVNNLLPDNPPGQDCQALQENNTPGCFSITNMHFHGLHVSPKCQDNICSDNVLNEILPGESQLYCVVLPTFHVPGTHWYHSHRHGATGLQVSNGMAGVIIVEEPADQQGLLQNGTLIPIPSEREKIWLIQEIVAPENDISVYQTGIGQNVGAFLVNGVYQPQITINAQQWQRWRFINAGATPRSLMDLRLLKQSTADPSNPTADEIVPLYMIAVDGISFYGNSPQNLKEDDRFNGFWDLAPGNRVDFVIWIPEPGEYIMVKSVNASVPGSPGNATPQQLTQILANITVTEETGCDPDPTICTIPGTAPNYLLPIEEREVFSDGSLTTQDIAFAAVKKGVYTINGGQYDMGQSLDVDFNTAQVWTLRTTKGSIHPFHIHVNPFQKVGDLIDPSGPNDASNWRWWDSIGVPNGKCIPIAQRFSDYDGEFVFHCHILIHEDQGMMQNLTVVADAKDQVDPCVMVSTPSFQPSKDPVYLTLDQVCSNLDLSTCTPDVCLSPTA